MIFIFRFYFLESESFRDSGSGENFFRRVLGRGIRDELGYSFVVSLGGYVDFADVEYGGEGAGFLVEEEGFFAVS